MILIIGGAYQGKGEYAYALSGLTREEFLKNLADGRKDRLEEAAKKPFLLGFHGWIRQVLDQGGSPEAFVKQVLAANPQIVTMDEVGCGLVPIERKEREYRETAGRAGQMLATHAQSVCRVVCGIPVRIK